MSALINATTAITELNDFAKQEDLNNTEFKQEYQVFQLIESQVHKDNKHFIGKINDSRGTVVEKPLTFSGIFK